MKRYYIYALTLDEVADGEVLKFLSFIGVLLWQNAVFTVELANRGIRLRKDTLLIYSISSLISNDRDYFTIIFINEELRKALEDNHIQIPGEYLECISEEKLPKGLRLSMRQSYFTVG